MKISIRAAALTLSLVSISAWSQTREIVRYFEECARTCSRECYQYGDLIQDRIDGFRLACGQPNPPPPPTGKTIEIFGTDKCTGDLIAVVSTESRCENLPSSPNNAWAIRVDGVCKNIADTSPSLACQRFKALGDAGAVAIYNNDRCEKDLVAAVSVYTDCQGLAQSGNDAWAIELGGRCINIDDMPLGRACERFQVGSDPRAVEIYKNDRCEKDLAAIAKPGMNCERLPDSGSDAWAIRVNGACTNITDISLRQACIRYAP